jgi:multidrug efflux pump subunit AcrA (membrane-fusion protein)
MQKPGFRRIPIIAAVIVVAAAAGFGMLRFSRHAPSRPTYQVKQEEFLDVLEFRGELKAMKSVTISAPANGSSLQILKIVADGTQVKKGDMIVQFDSSKAQQDLATDKSTLKSAQADINEARAQAILTEEQDKTAVSKARYDVQSAKLDASQQEILSKIDGAEAQLKVADAEQSLKEAEAKLRSDEMDDQAKVQDKIDASGKADFDVKRADESLTTTALTAPSAGTVSLVAVWHGAAVAPYSAGEQAWPGSPIAELPDVSSIRVSARVDETERGRLYLNQPVTAQMDAIVDRQFTGHIENISTIATSDFSAGWPIPRNFALQIVLDGRDSRLRPGMTVHVTVIVNRAPHAIAIPAQASFMKSGRTVAYVWNGSRFDERAIRVERKSRDRLLISDGLRSGDLIALTDPTEAQ